MEGAGRSFRLVCPPGQRKTVDELLRGQGFRFSEEPFHPLARKLTVEPFALGASLAARAGLIYIQDRSSMLPPLMLAPPPGAAVLDMCAAPGSKTSLLAQLVGRGGAVFGSEPNPQRLGILRNNLRRLSLPQTATVQSKGEKLAFAGSSFDYILLDPPCSGWGTEDKHPGVSGLWVGEKTKPLIRLQRKLLARAAALLAPGGRLVYSTCTTNPEEDEDQAAWAAAELGLAPLPLAALPGFVFEEPRSDAPGTLKVAEQSEGQGFFVAAFTRPDASKPHESQGSQKSQGLALPGKRLDPQRLDAPLGTAWDALPPGQVWDFGGRVYFLHDLALGLATPALRWQGLPLGRLAGREFRPDGLCRALIRASARADGAGVDLASEGELAALLDGRGLSGESRGEGRGAVCATYRGLPLGWLRARGGRLLWMDK